MRTVAGQDYPWTEIATYRAYDRTLPHWTPHEELATAVLRFLAPAQRILDAGCGTGLITERLAAPGKSIEGVDLNVAMIQVAHEKVARARGQLTFTVGNAECLSFDDESFDGVLSTNVVFSVESPARYLAELHRVIKTGGRLAIAGPTPEASRQVAALAADLQRELDSRGQLSRVREEFETVKRLNLGMADTGFRWTFTAAQMVKLLGELGFKAECFSDNFYKSAAFFVGAAKL